MFVTSAKETDLIDTLWNVKMLPSEPIRNEKIGFNRYIVECKVIVEVMVIISSLDLIDTLWNVKTNAIA